MSQRLSSQGVLWTLAALCLSAGVASRAGAADKSAGLPKAVAKAPAAELDPFGEPPMAAPHKPRVVLGPHPQAADVHRTKQALIATEPGKPKPVPHAKGDKPRAPHVPATGEAAIEKALAQRTDVDFVETPLSDALAYLKEFHDIQMVLDHKALEEVGVAPDTQITMKLQGVSLRSALGLILRQLDLTCIIHNEVLLITSRDVAQSPEYLTTKVYEVSDLVVCRDEKSQLWDDYETLEELVTSHVGINTWQEEGGPGTLTGISVGGAKLLVVTQSYPVHAELRELLQMLREHAAKAPGDKKPPQRNRPPEGSRPRGVSILGGMGESKGGIGGKQGGKGVPPPPQPNEGAPGGGKSSPKSSPQGDPID
jgi:hypothetical protein